MKRRLVNSQLTSYQSYMMYFYRCLSMAKNTFTFDDLPDDNLIDLDYVNDYLVRNSSIAWFKDDVLGLLALPYTSLSGLDIYGHPVKIEVKGKNGYHKILNRGEFVIMYDNSEKISILPWIYQYSERLSESTRTIDVNIKQQRTPRIWTTKSENVETLKHILNEIDGMVENVMGYDSVNLDDTNCVLEPAPFIADKVNDSKNAIWAEFFQMIGISSLTIEKKERVIRNEVNAMLGGNIAMRFSRFTPRQKAIEKINKLFGTEIKVRYYDGEPTTEKQKESEMGVDDNVRNDEFYNNE